MCIEITSKYILICSYKNIKSNINLLTDCIILASWTYASTLTASKHYLSQGAPAGSVVKHRLLLIQLEVWTDILRFIIQKYKDVTITATRKSIA